MRPPDTSLARRAPCGPEKLKSSRDGDAVLEDVEVLRQRQHRLHHVQAVHPLRIDLHQRLGQEVGLLLVVAFEADAVAGLDHRFEQGADGFGVDALAGEPRAQRAGRARQPGSAVLGLGVPVSGVHGSPMG